MAGQGFLSWFLAIAVLVLQGGDCVNLFAQKPMHDCCQKSPCNSKNLDPRCQVSLKLNLTQDLSKQRTPLVVLSALPVLPAWTFPLVVRPADQSIALSPPGLHGNFSTPLLV
jgi:hypothetical protein